MKSEVVRPPPARLKTVVLRSGPPGGRGRARDTILGVLGALLLFASVVLAMTLAEEDVILPQFQVDVGQVQFNFTSERLDFSDQQSQTLEFEIPEDNVFFILLDVGFQDDIAASDPDLFEVVLLNPEGTVVGERALIENPMGQPTESSFGAEYEAEYYSARLSYDFDSPPESGFATGLSPDDTEADVAMRFLEDNRRPTAGTWSVRITLQSAGNCPTGAAAAEDPSRALLCAAATNQGDDPGNQFVVEAFQYTYFEPRVSRL